jgi:hypothetical protein
MQSKLKFEKISAKLLSSDMGFVMTNELIPA